MIYTFKCHLLLTLSCQNLVLNVFMSMILMSVYNSFNLAIFFFPKIGYILFYTSFFQYMIEIQDMI